MGVRWRWGLACAQVLTVALAVLAALGVGRDVPFGDAALPLFAAAFTVLFAAGAIQTVRERADGEQTLLEDGVRAVGTALCGVLMVVTVAATIYLRFFFSFPDV